MYDAHTVLTIAMEQLQHAADGLFEAADMLSDLAAEYAGDRGMGVPYHGPKSNVTQLYAASEAVASMLERLESIAAEIG